MKTGVKFTFIEFGYFVIIPNAEPWTAVNKKKFSSICGIREITLKSFCLKRVKNVIKTRPTLPDCVTIVIIRAKFVHMNVGM